MIHRLWWLHNTQRRLACPNWVIANKEIPPKKINSSSAWYAIQKQQLGQWEIFLSLFIPPRETKFHQSIWARGWIKCIKFLKWNWDWDQHLIIPLFCAKLSEWWDVWCFPIHFKIQYSITRCLVSISKIIITVTKSLPATLPWLGKKKN